MEKIWLKSYPKNVLPEIKNSRYTSITDLFKSASDKFPNNIAFTNLNTKLTFKQTKKHAENFGANLHNTLSITRGSKVAIMLPNLLTYPVALFGSYIAGATVINVNPLYKSREIENALTDSGAETIIVLDRFLPELEPVVRKTLLKNMTDMEQTQIICQEFVEDIYEGDYRVLIIHGKPFEKTLARIPQEGDFKGNLAAGGKGVARDISEFQRQVGEEIGDYLMKVGINFAGIDIIGEYLTEINITSPTCAREILDQTDMNPISEYFEGL